ncbi:MAG: hypothetical protein PVG94_05520 [Gammaproteobacteria bacterium]
MKRLHLVTIIMLPLFIGCATQQVSYREDVLPILEERCIKCHLAPEGPGYIATGLKMDSYHSLMQGTYYGPVVFAGDSRRSILNMLVEGRAGKLQRMPHREDDGLNEKQVRTLREWVDQGALNN